MECIEQQSLGLFNQAHPELMPYLSRLANSTTVLNQYIMNRNDWYTMASVFIQQSGLPMLGLSTHNRGSVFFSSLAHLVSDYLSAAGYNCFASCTHYCSQGVLYRRHKMTAIDTTRHHARTDWPHWKFIQNELLPELVHQEPFYLVMHSEDTHPMFYLDQDCLKKLPNITNWPTAMAAIQCSDLLIQGFMERVRELGLEKNTEVVLYGDHLM
jgi:hypothetical protein